MAWPTQNYTINRIIYFICLVLVPFLTGLYGVSVGLVVAVVLGFYVLQRIMIPRNTRFLIGFLLLFVPAAIAYLVGWSVSLLVH
jgi:hypothetical protein